MVHVYFTRVEPRGPAQFSARPLVPWTGSLLRSIGYNVGFCGCQACDQARDLFSSLNSDFREFFFFWEKIFFHRKKLYLINY